MLQTTSGPTTADLARETAAGTAGLARIVDVVKVDTVQLDAVKVRCTEVRRREETTGVAAVGAAIAGQHST